MKIIGIDPGTGRLGWAILEVLPRQKAKLLEYGCFETLKNSKLQDRLEKIFVFLQSLIDQHKPDEMAAESLFFTKNTKTAFDVGAARGVILLCAKLKNLNVNQYTPTQIKSSLTGYGKAEKSQIQFMVTKILGLKEVPKPDDAADAVAIALTHSFHQKTK